MEHGLDIAAPVFQIIEQFLGRDDRQQFALAEVAPFFAGAQPIGYDQALAAARLESRDQVRADEARAARNDDHVGPFPSFDSAAPVAPADLWRKAASAASAAGPGF